MRVLVAEDDPIAQELIRSFLEGEGYQVTVASCGEEAWERYQASPARFVITDWKMPGVSGLELCRRIREENNGSYTYVVMLTANHEKGHFISGLAAGADDFVTKPFDPAELRIRMKSGARVLELEDKLEEKIAEIKHSREATEAAHQKLQEELDAAADVQRALLPTDLANSDGIDFAWSFEPSIQLGGDAFNIFRLAEDRFGFTFVDVCGHGLKSALLAVTVQHVIDPRYRHTSLLWADSATDPKHLVVPPTEVLSRLNTQFQMDMETAQYFSMLYGLLEADTGRIQYSTAGHPPPILIPAAGDIRQLEGTGFPIGIAPTADYDHYEMKLEPGDRLLFFSDGLTEVANEQREEAGTERVIGWINEGRMLGVNEVVRLLAENVRDWAAAGVPGDDVSILLVEYTGTEFRTANPSSAPLTRSS